MSSNPLYLVERIARPGWEAIHDTDRYSEAQHVFDEEALKMGSVRSRFRETRSINFRSARWMAGSTSS